MLLNHCKSSSTPLGSMPGRGKAFLRSRRLDSRKAIFPVPVGGQSTNSHCIQGQTRIEKSKEAAVIGFWLFSRGVPVLSPISTVEWIPAALLFRLTLRAFSGLRRNLANGRRGGAADSRLLVCANQNGPHGIGLRRAEPSRVELRRGKASQAKASRAGGQAASRV